MRTLIKDMFTKTIEKVSNQNGIPTILDNYILNCSKSYLQGEDNKLLEKIIRSFELSKKRYVKLTDRLENMNAGELNHLTRLYSQGKKDVLKYKGEPLFKSVFDKAIYEMLIYELKPGTIIELGSTNASLNWLSNLIRDYKLETFLVGVDINKLKNNYAKTIKMDVNKIELLSEIINLKNLKRPLLVIEDCHINIPVVLKFFDQYLNKGDYLLIEDSFNKQSILKQWAYSTTNYFVDTKYTDYFGINTTSAINSIIMKG